MIGQLGHIMVGVADSIMVGQLGTIPLAAVALANSIFAMLMVFGIGITSGITPLVAQADGKKLMHVPSVLLSHSFWLNFTLSIGICAILVGSASFLQFFGQEPEVARVAKPYLIIIASSIIPLMVFTTFKQFAEGLSDTKTAMVVTVLINILNVGLNYVLIYGKFGFPNLGIIGAGWATLISRVLMMIVMWAYVIKDKRFLDYNLKIRLTYYRNKIMRRLLQVGVPTGLQYTFEVSAFAIAAIFAGMINAVSLAAHQIAINIASVSYMAVTGLGAAATVRVGNQAGRKNLKTLKLAASTIFNMSIIWMGLAGIFIYLFRHQLAHFYSNDPVVLALASKMLIVVVLFQLSDGIQAVALGALRGLTDVKMPAYITFAAYWLFTLPLAYTLSQHTDLGAMGIWYALALGLTLSATLLVWRFRRLLVTFNR
jgi:MATE family multidrug resistance protein